MPYLAAVEGACRAHSGNNVLQQLFLIAENQVFLFQFTARLTSVTGTLVMAGNNAYRYGLLMTEDISSVAAYVDAARFAELGYFTQTVTPTFTLTPSRAWI